MAKPTSPDQLDIDASPYFAGLEGKANEEASALQDRIEVLPKAAKEFLFAGATQDAVRTLVESAGLEERYVLAVAKIVFFVVLGDVPPASIATLLERLEVPPDKAQRIAQGITTMLAPVMTAKARAVVGDKPREIAPLTRTVGGIIDLRKPNGQ